MIGVGLVILATFLWAFDTLIRYPLLESGMQATSIVFYEHLLLVFPAIYFISKSFKKFWSTSLSSIFYMFLIGVLGSALATLAFTEAFALINPSLVIILQKLQPIWAMMLASLWLKEPIKKAFLIWSCVAIIGAVLVSYNDLSTILVVLFKDDGGFSKLFEAKALKGYLFALLAVFGWGSSTVLGKKLTLLEFNEKEIMSGRFLFGFLALLPFLYPSPWNVVDIGGVEFGKIIILVLISGVLGMYLYYKGLKKIPARLCALAELTFPFCAIIVNWIFLGAKLSAVEMVGGAVLVLSATIIQIKHY